MSIIIMTNTWRSGLLLGSVKFVTTVALHAFVFASATWADWSNDLEEDLKSIERRTTGRLGVGVSWQNQTVFLNPNDRFSLQSVMKLIVVAAAFDASDRKGARLQESVTLYPKDRSLYVQPIAKQITAAGFQTTVIDLAARAVIQSDSTAADFLFVRVGGSEAISEFLRRARIEGLRVDRDERQLQTEIMGISWKSEFADPRELDRAIAAIPVETRNRAFSAYLGDPRDTGTPRGMITFLQALDSGQLLTPGSSAALLAIMARTSTFPDRLKAGVPSTWTVAHKTGTSGQWQGITAATNDVGFLIAPNGERIAIAVFVADSPENSTARARIIADVAEAVTRRVPTGITSRP